VGHFENACPQTAGWKNKEKSRERIKAASDPGRGSRRGYCVKRKYTSQPGSAVT
jgi:hypothetical protein